MQTVKLEALEATPDTFAPYGQVIKVAPDMDLFGPQDAQLDLSQGIPRFYIIRIKRKIGLEFDAITYHDKVTQCLAAASENIWYMCVASPSAKPAPKIEDIKAFRIPPKTIVKLERGTWHAGPLITNDSSTEFYNLELSDTNQVDHQDHDFKAEGVRFLVEDKNTA